MGIDTVLLGDRIAIGAPTFSRFVCILLMRLLPDMNDPTPSGGRVAAVSEAGLLNAHLVHKVNIEPD